MRKNCSDPYGKMLIFQVQRDILCPYIYILKKQGRARTGTIMNLLQQKLAESLTIFDGAIGTEIYRRNFFVNASFEQLNLTAPDVILDIHHQYLKAGAEVLTTNTYNANSRRLAKFGLSEQTEAINRAGVKLAVKPPPARRWSPHRSARSGNRIPIRTAGPAPNCWPNRYGRSPTRTSSSSNRCAGPPT